MTSEPKYPTSTNKKLALLLVLLVSLALVLFSTAPFISKEKVEEQLQFSAETLAAYAQDNGSDANFTYGEVEITGVLYEKKAKVLNPSLTFSRSNWGGNKRVTISSEYMFVLPQPVGGTGVTVQFSEPLSISENGGPASTATFEGCGPIYKLSKTSVKGEEALLHTLNLPPALSLAPVNDPENITYVTFDEKPKLELTQLPASNTAQSVVEFGNVSIADPKTVITFGAVSSTLVRKPAEEGKMAFDSVITVSDIGYKHGDELDGPYSIKFSAEGTRVAAVDGKLPPPNTNITLREFLITSDQFRLNATGTIARTADDFMPYGKAEVKVENFSSLRNSNSLSPELKSAIVETASRITGEDASASDSLGFTIAREKMGDITVGRASFEEIVTTFLSRIMLGGAAPASPPAPEESGNGDAETTVIPD